MGRHFGTPRYMDMTRPGQRWPFSWWEPVPQRLSKELRSPKTGRKNWQQPLAWRSLKPSGNSLPIHPIWAADSGGCSACRTLRCRSWRPVPSPIALSATPNPRRGIESRRGAFLGGLFSVRSKPGASFGEGSGFIYIHIFFSTYMRMYYINPCVLFWLTRVSLDLDEYAQGVHVLHNAHTHIKNNVQYYIYIHVYAHIHIHVAYVP